MIYAVCNTSLISFDLDDGVTFVYLIRSMYVSKGGVSLVSEMRRKSEMKSAVIAVLWLYKYYI